MDQANRETGSILQEIHQNLLSQRERFSNNNARIRNLASKLLEENKIMEAKNPCGVPVAQVSGIAKDLADDVESFRELNYELEELIDRLSKVI